LAAQGFRPDVIHAHVYEAGLPAVLIGRLHKIPVVVSEHYTGFPRKLLSRREVRKAKLAFRLAKNVLPVSHSLQRGIEAYGIRARFQVIPNVVDTSLFYPALSKPSDRDPNRLLFVGLLDPSHKKGVPYLLRALAQLQERREDWHLDIVGDGEARTEYERMARELGIADKVSFLGLKPKEEVAEFMRQADLFVLPSLYETFAVVVAEALACGIPVLATRSGGPEEFVTNDVGMLVPPGDSHALCEGLDYMLSHLDDFIPANISNYANRRFSPESIGAQLQAIYEQAIALDFEMFNVGYSGKRVSISKHWRVLDVGSGHNPHPRADVLLDEELGPNADRSYRPAVRDSRPFVIANAQYLPFKDQSFDYAIASHIVEHLPDPAAFCRQLRKIVRRGYIECPGPLGEWLLGEPFHLWVVYKKGPRLIFKRKKQSNWLLQQFSNLFYALFYVGQERVRWTLNPKTRAIRGGLFRLSQLMGKIWRSRLLRHWTYTSFEFNFDFEVKVLIK
jgi:glycosyltransferase involved in cell wall biosynthesis